MEKLALQGNRSNTHRFLRSPIPSSPFLHGPIPPTFLLYLSSSHLIEHFQSALSPDFSSLFFSSSKILIEKKEKEGKPPSLYSPILLLPLPNPFFFSYHSISLNSLHLPPSLNLSSPISLLLVPQNPNERKKAPFLPWSHPPPLPSFLFDLSSLYPTDLFTPIRFQIAHLFAYHLSHHSKIMVLLCLHSNSVQFFSSTPLSPSPLNIPYGIGIDFAIFSSHSNPHILK